MNFLSFEYFQAIRQAGTIRKAAEQLYISPQALSEQLGKLERELDAALFLRTTPLILTEAGESFAQCAQTCLKARQKLDQELNRVRIRESGRVCLGVPTGMPPPFLLSFTEFFRQTHPEFELIVTELPTKTGALSEIPPHIDVAMGAFSQGDRLRHIVILESSRFVVAVHRSLLRRVLGPALAKVMECTIRTGELLPLSSFRNFPFVLKRPGSIIRNNEDRLFRAAGFICKGPVETGDLELSVRMTLLGQAAIYLPEPMARANFLTPEFPEQENPILLCPVCVMGERWELTAAHSAHRPLSPGGSKLVETAMQYYRNRLGCGDETQEEEQS